MDGIYKTRVRVLIFSALLFPFSLNLSKSSEIFKLFLLRYLCLWLCVYVSLVLMSPTLFWSARHFLRHPILCVWCCVQCVENALIIFLHISLDFFLTFHNNNRATCLLRRNTLYSLDAFGCMYLLRELYSSSTSSSSSNTRYEHVTVPKNERCFKQDSLLVIVPLLVTINYHCKLYMFLFLPPSSRETQ